MSEIRILTVRQPWAWAIIHAGKDVENRVRNIAGDYRGPVAIHAARADATNAPESLWLKHADYYAELYRSQGIDGYVLPTMRGQVIGVVDLVDVHSAGRHYENIGVGVLKITDSPCCPPWGVRSGQHGTEYHLNFANPRPLRTPVPFKGALGLRRFDSSLIEGGLS